GVGGGAGGVAAGGACAGGPGAAGRLAEPRVAAAVVGCARGTDRAFLCVLHSLGRTARKRHLVVLVRPVDEIWLIGHVCLRFEIGSPVGGPLEGAAPPVATPPAGPQLVVVAVPG